MRNRNWLKVSSVLAGLAVLVSACNKTTTAPNNSKTETVTATSSVSATPTSPVSVQTTGSQSNVSATFDVASLQQIVAATGGATSITMSDLASKDYGQLGSKTQTDLSSAQGVQGVLSFSFTKSTSDRAANMAFDGAAQLAGDPTISYKVIGTDACPTATSVYGVAVTATFPFYVTSGVLSKSSGLISGSLSIPSPLPNPLVYIFLCPNFALNGYTGATG